VNINPIINNANTNVSPIAPGLNPKNKPPQSIPSIVLGNQAKLDAMLPIRVPPAVTPSTPNVGLTAN
jgi:hypothetical protein